MSAGAFLIQLRDLCRLRRGAEDMPYAPGLLLALLVAYGVLHAGFDHYQGASAPLVAAALLGSLAALAMLFALLRGRGLSERFVQTATALAAASLVFGIIADALALLLPLKALRAQLLAHPTQPPALTPMQTLVLLVIAALNIWMLCVWVRILRGALNLPVAGGVLVLFALVFVNVIATGVVAGLLGVA